MKVSINLPNKKCSDLCSDLYIIYISLYIIYISFSLEVMVCDFIIHDHSFGYFFFYFSILSKLEVWFGGTLTLATPLSCPPEQSVNKANQMTSNNKQTKSSKPHFAWSGLVLIFCILWK